MIARRSLLQWSASTGLGAVLAGLPGRSHGAGDARLALVVASDSPLQNLSLYELKRLYLGANINDPSGSRIVPFNQPARTTDRMAFDESVLRMDPDRVAKYWIDRKIRGQSGAPKAVGSADLLQRVVTRVSHSLAYVRVDQVRDDVRVLSIDGKKPGDQGYAVIA